MNEITKIPMSAPEVEKLVVSTMLSYNETIILITPILKADCFTEPKLKLIYSAIVHLHAKGQPVDHMAVIEELRRTSKLADAGGMYFVVKCDTPAFGGTIENHARIIYQYFVLREMAKTAMMIYNRCHEPNADPFEIVQMASREIAAVDYISKSNIQVVGDVVTKVLADNKQVLEQGKKEGISTGLYNVDQYHVKQKQEFGIIAARPGMGKTAYMLQNAKNSAVNLKNAVLIFSLEMSTEKLVGRLMASEAQISSQEINHRTLTQQKLQILGANITRLLDAPMYFDDSADLDITTMRSKIRKMKQQHNIQEVYIDYLQLMAGEKKGNREQEISYISRQLKKTAKQENIPIIALCQLSRDVEKRPDKKPQLSDLRESGAIEQDADWVFFLFRPEYYGLENKHNGLYEDQTFTGKHLPAANLLVVDCAKYREGSLFKAPLKFYGEFMQVENHGIEPTLEEKLQAPAALKDNTSFLNDVMDENSDLPF